jgi:hypothetical protein
VHGLATNNLGQAGKAAVNLAVNIASGAANGVTGFAMGMVTMQPDSASQIVPWCSIYGQEEPSSPEPDAPGIIETLVTQSHEFFGLSPPQ